MGDYTPPPIWTPPAIVAKAPEFLRPPVKLLPSQEKARTTTVKTAPAVAVKKGFQSGNYNADHTCPNCGRQQWVVQSGRANAPGHTHRCPSCSTQWWH
jgi:predicted RNA-binding Zn-ribbon protein involved in translation (DUF1610 family)